MATVTKNVLKKREVIILNIRGLARLRQEKERGLLENKKAEKEMLETIKEMTDSGYVEKVKEKLNNTKQRCNFVGYLYLLLELSDLIEAGAPQEIALETVAYAAKIGCILVAYKETERRKEREYLQL